MFQNDYLQARVSDNLVLFGDEFSGYCRLQALP